HVTFLKFESLRNFRHQMGGKFAREFATLRKLLSLRRRCEKTNDGHCNPNRPHEPFPPFNYLAVDCAGGGFVKAVIILIFNLPPSGTNPAVKCPSILLPLLSVGWF